MKVRNTVPLQLSRMIGCIADDPSVILFVSNNNQLEIITIDVETLGIISSFPVQTGMSVFYEPCIDDDCIYFPTPMGQILGLDKFSGEILTTINLGLPIMSDLVQDEQNIYCICGVPISKKWKLVTDLYCLCICDKETGEKKVQTSYFPWNPGFLNVSDQYVWSSVGAYIIKFDKTGELILKSSLGTPVEYHPVLSSQHLLCCSSNGMLQIVKQEDLKIKDFVRTSAHNVSGPLLINDEEVIWWTTQGVCKAHLGQLSFSKVAVNKKMSGKKALISDKSQLIGCDKSGSLVLFDIHSDRNVTIKLSNTELYDPLVVDNFIFVASQENAHCLEV